MVLNRNKGEPDFIITNKEEQVLQQFREKRYTYGLSSLLCSMLITVNMI